MRRLRLGQAAVKNPLQGIETNKHGPDERGEAEQAFPHRGEETPGPRRQPPGPAQPGNAENDSEQPGGHARRG